MVELSFRNPDTPCVDAHMVEDVWNSMNSEKYSILKSIAKAGKFCRGGKFLYETLLQSHPQAKAGSPF